GGARPATGSVVARIKNSSASTRNRSSLPPFIVIGGKLHQGKKSITGEGGGALGGLVDPFRLEYDPVHGTKVPALQLPADLTPERLTNRQELMRAFSSLQNQTDLLHAG